MATEPLLSDRTSTLTGSVNLVEFPRANLGLTSYFSEGISLQGDKERVVNTLLLLEALVDHLE